MRRILFLLMLLVPFMCFAQVQDPIKWSFSSKKISQGTYEIHLAATIQSGWHTYSQTTPDGGPIPTTFKFSKNPLLTMTAGVNEIGKLEQHNEPLFGVDVKQFSNKVDFVQLVNVKGNAKTAVTGSVEYMVCNDRECLPPKEVKFSIAIK